MRGHVLLVVVVLAAVVLAAVGCGESQAPASAVDDREALLAFTDCMRERGIALADPVIEGDSVRLLPPEGEPLAPRERFEAAQRACREHLPAGLANLGGAADPADTRAREEGALRFADCVREQGFDLPDPRFADGRIVNWDPEALGVDLDDPEVRRVAQLCTDESGFDPRERA